MFFAYWTWNWKVEFISCWIWLNIRAGRQRSSVRLKTEKINDDFTRRRDDGKEDESEDRYIEWSFRREFVRWSIDGSSTKSSETSIDRVDEDRWTSDVRVELRWSDRNSDGVDWSVLAWCDRNCVRRRSPGESSRNTNPSLHTKTKESNLERSSSSSRRDLPDALTCVRLELDSLFRRENRQTELTLIGEFHSIEDVLFDGEQRWSDIEDLHVERGFGLQCHIFEQSGRKKSRRVFRHFDLQGLILFDLDLGKGIRRQAI